MHFGGFQRTKKSQKIRKGGKRNTFSYLPTVPQFPALPCSGSSVQTKRISFAPLLEFFFLKPKASVFATTEELGSRVDEGGERSCLKFEPRARQLSVVLKIIIITPHTQHKESPDSWRSDSCKQRFKSHSS